MEKGFRSGKLVTIEKVQNYKRNPRQPAKWKCKCDCGNEKITNQASLKEGSVKSCGCHEWKGKKIYGKENYEALIKEKILKSILINDNDCWIWQKAKHRQGYGNLSYKRIPRLAHRVCWEVYFGEIPENIKVCHKCDNPSCVNPEHLFLGTQKDNVRDGIEKGRYENRAMGKRRNKLNYDEVLDIKRLNSEGMTRKELQKKYSVSPTCIAKILNGVSWKIN